MTVGRKVRVFGRVQGVFFRQWTLDQARALGVNGWVRNCADGSVEARLQGNEESVEKLITAMRTGPSHARVEELTVEPAELEEQTGFSVRH